ncbi:hypothetical protein OGAPHI_004956 [Ogataea philodendri]|uniref:Uncharacterized protein n=1 Tax=Ogataea philodendri TaxID=1378263 RepID=A0A9P8P1H8_9ASCO|nr:uncharacterized protein OGAPHI_004956 [Ogataea philodendri]KAH3663555.1 hypothetical protein OGAPHI_004956 [Ogataea philodendri]
MRDFHIGQSDLTGFRGRQESDLDKVAHVPGQNVQSHTGSNRGVLTSVLGVSNKTLHCVLIAQFWSFSVLWQVIQHKVQQWIQRVVLAFVNNVSFQRLGPLQVVCTLNVVAKLVQSSQHFVKSDTWMAGHVNNRKRGSRRRMQSSSNNNTGNVVHRHSVDAVGDVRVLANLNTALQHTEQEIVRVGSTSLGETLHITRSDDSTSETLFTGLSDNILGSPLGLSVPGSQAFGSTHEVVGLGNTSLSGIHKLVRKRDVVWNVDGRGGRHKRVHLWFTFSTKIHYIDGRNDVGVTQFRVWVHPVDQSSVVHNHVDRRHKCLPLLLVAKVSLGKVSKNNLDLVSPFVIPDTVSLSGLDKSLQSRLFIFCTNVSPDLDIGFSAQQVTQDERSQESSTSRHKHVQWLCEIQRFSGWVLFQGSS